MRQPDRAANRPEVAARRMAARCRSSGSSPIAWSMTASSPATRAMRARRTSGPSRTWRAGIRQQVAEMRQDLAADRVDRGGEPRPRLAEFGQARHRHGAGDSDDDLAGAGDGEDEGLVGVRDRVARDDRQRVARQREGIGGEVARQRVAERAGGHPQRHADQEADAVLRVDPAEHHRGGRPHDGADHAEETLAQRGPEDRLAHDRRRSAGPGRVVELEREGDEQRQRHRRRPASPRRGSSAWRPRARPARRHRGGRPGPLDGTCVQDHLGPRPLVDQRFKAGNVAGRAARARWSGPSVDRLSRSHPLRRVRARSATDCRRPMLSRRVIGAPSSVRSPAAATAMLSRTATS